VRSPHRIDPFLRALGDAWKADPDQRFGQLVMNLTRNERGQFEDPWEWEDSEWYRRMQRAQDEVPA
jgi:hypothetical protein